MSTMLLIGRTPAGRILAETELDGGTQHARRRHAQKGFGLDPTVVQPRAWYGVGDEVADGKVPGAGDHLDAGLAGRHRGDLVLRRSGKRPKAVDPGNHDAVEVDISFDHPLDLVAGQ